MASDKQGKDVLEAKVLAIREQIQRGEYQVDAHAVADAIIRRLAAIASAPSADGTQAKCSYPESPPA